MPLAKYAAAICSSCHPHCTYGGILSSTSSLSLRRPAASTPHRRQVEPRQQRSYATVNDPHEWPRSPNPTPYQILNHPRGQPYSKKRFYELVKIYHPDRNDHSSPSSSHPSTRNLTAPQKLERYRLIVAANDLLSDPEKKELYDSHGLGWEREDHHYQDPTAHRETMRTADRAWRSRAHSAAHNATWEDWERWHHERAARANPDSPGFDHARFGKGSPLYMSNGMFASLVVLMCMVGALAQRTRAEGEGERFLQLKASHDEVVGESMRRSSERGEGRSQDQRIDLFLRDRESSNWGAHSGIPGGEDR